MCSSLTQSKARRQNDIGCGTAANASLEFDDSVRTPPSFPPPIRAITRVEWPFMTIEHSPHVSDQWRPRTERNWCWSTMMEAPALRSAFQHRIRGLVLGTCRRSVTPNQFLLANLTCASERSSAARTIVSQIEGNGNASAAAASNASSAPRRPQPQGPLFIPAHERCRITEGWPIHQLALPAPPGRRRTTSDDIGGEHESPPSLKKTQTAGYLVGPWQSQAQGSRGTNMRQVLNAFRPIGPLFMHSAHLSGQYTLWEF
jgi:hypothetical protein